VDPPAHFRLVKPYWFECPYCGLRKFAAYGAMRVRQTGLIDSESILLYCFWCPGCNRYCALTHPAAAASAGLVLGLALFLVMYAYLAPLGWLMIVPATIGGLGMPLPTRLLNRYVPLDRSAGP
jgi:hypothetical protein